ncbi:MAG: SpaA isopeptide-forming pilin-related protein [Eubacteriales bacterium]|nr:SpaA isopeptide-forming pilin-related protein [Eubacteriales bacterium]
MKQWKKIIPLLLIVGMLCATSMTAFAATESQKGSIKITVAMDDQTLSGGKIKLYQVASITEAGGYTYTDGFADCDVPLSRVQADNLTAEKAVLWSAYAEQHQISGTELPVDKNGTASDSGLELGLYLIQQGTAAEGYTMSETVVPLPLEEADGSLNYIVEAVPKVAETTPSDEPGQNGSGSDSPSKSGGSKSGGKSSKLPQTGQLWWPVSLLAIGGILLYSFGWNENRKCSIRR